MKHHTLLDLCRAYDKIEIPILQRDYVQGSNVSVRTPFVKYLVDALVMRKRVELDFVYGGVRCASDGTHQVLIPLDGQQRLTTLWLLHVYLLSRGVASDKATFDHLQELLKRFVYETRPYAQDFARRVLADLSPIAEDTERRQTFLDKPKAYLTNRGWFDEVWYRDATITAMLEMLDEIAQYRDELASVSLSMLDGEEALLVFYFLSLDSLGLTDEVYIRMNARGEALTSFEHFKSSLYKVLQRHPSFAEIKDKMEYAWVEHLWQYRAEGQEVTDDVFMRYLSFVSQICHIKQSATKGDYQEPKPLVKKADPYTEVGFITELYSQEGAVDSLVHALDALPQLKSIDYQCLSKGWGQETSFGTLLNGLLTGGLFELHDRVLLYTALEFIRQYGSAEGIESHLRVVRNLVYNTDYQTRDLPLVYASVDRLVAHRDVYDYLAGGAERLAGFRETYQPIEEWKARLRKQRPEIEDVLNRQEDYFTGNVTNMLCVLMDVERLSAGDGASIDLEELERVFDSYKRLYKLDDFCSIWGDLLLSDVYHAGRHSGRWVMQDDVCRAKGLFRFVRAYATSGMEVQEFCRTYERAELRKLLERTGGDLAQLREPSEQLFVYYVISCRLMHRSTKEFFRNGYNFGWLSPATGFSSMFEQGPEDWSSSPKVIYQTFSRQFRYNEGLKDYAALPPEIVGAGRPQIPFERLVEWVNEEAWLACP